MKKTMPLLLAAFVFVTSCTKENLGVPSSSITESTASASRGSDDAPGDDRGGSVGSGGGTRISASSVPAKVMNAFKTRFPNAARIEWKKLANGNYKVQFYRNGIKWEAIYSPSGVLLKLERD